VRCLAVIASIMLLSAVDASAQGQASRPGSAGGTFFGPVFKISRLNDQRAVIVGGRGGWSINDSLTWGFGGYSLINHVDAPPGVFPQSGPLDIKLLYGGLELEQVMRRGARAQITVSALFGGGAHNYVRDLGGVTRSDEQVGETDFGFVLEPGINVDFRVTRWLQVSPGASYRLVTGVDQIGLDGRDLDGVAATLAFKFRRF
jgi:hypothetical protein